MKYRPEIDGLRAIAVISVVLFHADFELFSGGFIGVDIFFVISGYLITTIIIEEVKDGQFSLTGFYERRARRILPALFFMMLCCIPFAWFWMLPSQLIDFSQSLVAVSLFGSNILFWLESGYFADAASEKPLLHTWSLAVEEQYYLLFPIFFVFLWKRNQSVATYLVIFAALASFLLSEWGWRNHAVANFYFAPTRFWELLVGSIAALVIQRRGFSGNAILSFTGLLIVISTIFLFDKNVPSPSIYTLATVFGVILIILYAGTINLTGKILSIKFFVGIGLISYSLYLWHQPVIAFSKIRFNNQYNMIFLIIIVFLMSYFSWKFIERPFRIRANLSISRKAILHLSLYGIAFFICLGIYGISGNGHGWRIKYVPDNTMNAQRLAHVLKEWNFSGYDKPASMYKDTLTGLDRIGNNDDAKVLFIGDSHMHQYWNSFDNTRYGNKSEKSILFKTMKFPPGRGSLPIDIDPAIETVALSYFWALAYGSDTVNQAIRCCGNGPDGTVGEITVPHKNSAEMDAIDRALERFISEVKSSGRKIYLILDNPFGEELNAQSMLKIEGTTISPSEIDHLEKNISIDRSNPARARLLAIAEKHDVSIIDPVEHLCQDTLCPAFSDSGNLIYKDYDHISVYASKNMADYILAILK